MRDDTSCCMGFLHAFSGNRPDGKLPSVHFLSKFHLTCLQFFVPISRAMEQKLLKYVPCNTLNSDSSAPLHWTTEDSCAVTSSSPGRNLVGVWQREFPSVVQRHMRKKTLAISVPLHGKKDITINIFFILHTTAHLYSFFRMYLFRCYDFLVPCCIDAWTHN